METVDRIELNGILYDESLHPISRGKHIVRLAQVVSLGLPGRLQDECDTEIPGVDLTLEEVVEIAKFWTREILVNHFNCFLWGGHDTDWRLGRRAIGRLESFANLAGRDIIKNAVDEAILEYGKEADPRYWEVFWYGTPEEQEQVMDEFRRELQREIEAEESADGAKS